MPDKRRPSRHVALLRGINVGGKNKLPMKDLVRLVEALGGSSVRTYIQSGNVVFEATAAVAARMPLALGTAIAREFALRVPVVLRSAEELRAAVQANPFLERRLDPATLHVAFLADAPSEERVSALDPARSPGDTFLVWRREIFLHLPNGVARTRLTNDYFDRTLATVSTLRNWATTNALLELASN